MISHEYVIDNTTISRYLAAIMFKGISRMMRICLLLLMCLHMGNPSIGFAQDVTVKIGHKDSLYSAILDEHRSLVISLPDNYEDGKENYPVLYLLDGTTNNLLDARLVTFNLKMDMIIVALANTDRDRDMMPLSRPSYIVENPKAENFLLFIEKELIPHIDKNYRTKNERTIRGRSLSGLFVMYAFLKEPRLFTNYIGNCAGWFADMDDYFTQLAEDAFQQKSDFGGKSIFVANSLSDPLDPKQEIHHAVLKFSKLLKSEVGELVKFKYQTYENAGHVP
ncbi:MAG TPA: hypothetical protein DEA82_11300, partial [Flavobacteriaceae bacterium]|nr:hypothetical protein [Flavobacteriaceae bacterium]